MGLDLMLYLVVPLLHLSSKNPLWLTLSPRPAEKTVRGELTLIKEKIKMKPEKRCVCYQRMGRRAVIFAEHDAYKRSICTKTPEEVFVLKLF